MGYLTKELHIDLCQAIAQYLSAPNSQVSLDSLQSCLKNYSLFQGEINLFIFLDLPKRNN
jgi:hypothetical protein